MARKLIYKTEIAGLEIKVIRTHKKRLYRDYDGGKYQVTYGKQTLVNLDYAQAAAELGQSIMHARGCEGAFD